MMSTRGKNRQLLPEERLVLQLAALSLVLWVALVAIVEVGW